MKQVYKVIEQELRKYPKNENAKWKAVCDKVFDRFKWTQSGDLIRMYYSEKKTAVIVAMELSISERQFYYIKHDVLDIAYKWAICYKLL